MKFSNSAWSSRNRHWKAYAPVQAMMAPLWFVFGEQRFETFTEALAASDAERDAKSDAAREANA